MVHARTLTPRIALLGGLFGLLVACGREPAPPVAPVAPPVDTAYLDGEHAWRLQRREELLRPDGWTSLVGLHWIEPGPHYVGSGARNGIRLAAGPLEIGLFDLRKDGTVRLTPARGVALTLDGTPLRGVATLHSDADAAGASKLGFDDGKGLLTLLKRGARHALRVKHADAPTRTAFVGLDYWPVDPAWRVEARFLPHPPGKTLAIANIIGIIEPVPNPGAVEFTREGKTFRLEALDQGDGGLFLVFADRTNGHGSYGAGRFLDAPMPDARGRVPLDFNRAYNPPCAFTAFATCPLPPSENRLDLAITAGEKAYHRRP